MGYPTHCPAGTTNPDTGLEWGLVPPRPMAYPPGFSPYMAVCDGRVVFGGWIDPVTQQVYPHVGGITGGWDQHPLWSPDVNWDAEFTEAHPELYGDFQPTRDTPPEVVQRSNAGAYGEFDPTAPGGWSWPSRVVNLDLPGGGGGAPAPATRSRLPLALAGAALALVLLTPAEGGR